MNDGLSASLGSIFPLEMKKPGTESRTLTSKRARIALSFSPSCPTDAILLLPPSVVRLSAVQLYVCPRTTVFMSSYYYVCVANVRELP
jgi:hypothetical protein